MQTSPPGRLVVSIVTFALAILILILATVNYLRITQIDNSPIEGVTQIRPTSTPTAPTSGQTPLITSTITSATPGAEGTQSPTDTAIPTAEPASPTQVPTLIPLFTSLPTPTIDLTPTPSSPSEQALLSLSRPVVAARAFYSIAAR